MKCPACETLLSMTERQGVEIDYCPSCRGIWLDRGELDKLLALRAPDERPPERPGRSYYSSELEDSDDRRPAYGRDDRQQYPKKRESFWSNLFDFD
jgi:Zn-finger nucleic acid-binding protein